MKLKEAIAFIVKELDNSIGFGINIVDASVIKEACNVVVDYAFKGRQAEIKEQLDNH